MVRQVSVILFAVVLLTAGVFGLRLSASYYQRSNAEQAKDLSLPPMGHFDPATLKVLFLGHERVYDAFISIWHTQTLNSSELTGEYAERLANQVVQLAKFKPQLERTLFIATCAVLFNKLQRADLCFQVTEAGIKSVPESWAIPLTQGYVEGFILKNRERAAFFYFLAAQKPDSPDYVKRVAEKFARQSESLTDEDYINSMNTLMNATGGERFLDFLNDVLSGDKQQ